ncbi:MAG: Peptidase Imelysin [Mucilaginibacter sp.]|nr:Peptidase Imelysin [Mucilaginibacter sp.]
MRKFICLALIAATTFILIQSCKKSDAGNPNNTGSSFDRKGVLTNISTNIIIPGYTAYQAATVNLDAAVTTFTAASNSANLVALQTAFQAAYKQWQVVSVFEIGPAAQIQLRVNTNTFPADINQINSNIATSTYNPGLLSNLAAKGFPALDYLLFGVGADNTAILAQYTTGANATYSKTYLAALSAELKKNATTVLNGWTATYKTTFINADGTDVGSSIGQLTNQLVFDYETLKNYEIGIPAGIQSMGTTYPQKVQAYYSKMSVQLVLLHLQTIQNIYTGSSGPGFDDYLISAKAQYNGGSLNSAIIAQFASATSKLQGLTDPLSLNIQTNNAAVTSAYTELQKLTVLLKTDMTSSLGILITYGDNDGD